MESSRTLLDRCNAHEPLSDSNVEIVSVMAKEWKYLRECRHAELNSSIKECAKKNNYEVCMHVICFCTNIVGFTIFSFHCL